MPYRNSASKTIHLPMSLAGSIYTVNVSYPDTRQTLYVGSKGLQGIVTRVSHVSRQFFPSTCRKSLGTRLLVSPVEAFPTGIKIFDWQKLCLIVYILHSLIPRPFQQWKTGWSMKRRHSHDKCTWAFSIFAAPPLLCIILNTNRRTKTGEAWEWGYDSRSPAS